MVVVAEVRRIAVRVERVSAQVAEIGVIVMHVQSRRGIRDHVFTVVVLVVELERGDAFAVDGIPVAEGDDAGRTGVGHDDLLLAGEGLRRIVGRRAGAEGEADRGDDGAHEVIQFAQKGPVSARQRRAVR